MSASQPKLTYRPRAKLEVFYTGGAARLSPDGSQLACACGDETRVVAAATGEVLHTLPGDSEPVTALAFSPDGSRIYTASRSLQQRSWHVETARTLRAFKGHRAPVTDMAVDASGGLLASASADSSVRVWDTDGGYCTHVFNGHSGVVFSVLFHPKQMTLVSGGNDAEVRLWDLVDKSCVAVLKGHFSAVTALSLAPDNWTLLSGSRDKTVHVWDMRSYAKLATIPIHEAVEGVVALPAHVDFPGVVSAKPGKAAGGKRPVYFVTAGERGRLRIWRSDTGHCVYEQPERPGGSSAGNEMTWLASLPDGKGLVAATGDCRFLMFAPQASAEGRNSSLAITHQLVGNNDEVTDLRFIGPAGAPTHLAVATNSPAIRIFDTATLGCTASLEGHTDIVLALDALEVGDESSKGRRTLLLSGSKDNTMRLWEAATARCLGIGEGHIAAVSAVAFSRKGPRFAVTGGADKLLKVWDLPAALAEADSSAEQENKVVAMRVTAAVAAHDKDINALAVSPNDALVVTASQDRTAKVWKLPSLVAVLTLRGHKRGVWDAAFSPVDQAVITASGDKTIRLWGLADGACLRTFEGHSASALRCTFLSAGTQLLSAGADGLLKLWAVRNAECISTFDEHEGKVWALAINKSENLLATGSADATVAIWEDSTAADQAATAEEEEAVVLKQQDLANALQSKDYAGAAALAFDMKQPRRLLAVVEAITGSGDQSAASPILEDLAAAWDKEQLRTALEYIREWNTNSQVCHAAQALLAAVLQRHPPQEILSVSGIAELLEGLAAYTQNHFARIGRLQRSAYLLDYTLSCMNVLMPTEHAAGGAAATAATELATVDGPTAHDAPSPPATPPQSTASGALDHRRSSGLATADVDAARPLLRQAAEQVDVATVAAIVMHVDREQDAGEAADDVQRGGFRRAADVQQGTEKKKSSKKQSGKKRRQSEGGQQPDTPMAAASQRQQTASTSKKKKERTTIAA